MKHFSMVISDSGEFYIQKSNGALIQMMCPYSGKPCGEHCPLFGQIMEYGPVMGPGYFIDLRCGAGVRIESQHNRLYK